MDKNVRIAKELVKIAKSLIAVKEGLTSIDPVKFIENSIGNNHINGLNSEYVDYFDVNLNEGDFKDAGIFEWLNQRNMSGGSTLFRVFFKFHTVETEEYWSGRHDDYEPSHKYGLEADSDTIVVLAACDESTGIEYYDVTGELTDAKISALCNEVDEKKFRYEDDCNYAKDMRGYAFDDF